MQTVDDAGLNGSWPSRELLRHAWFPEPATTTMRGMPRSWKRERKIDEAMRASADRRSWVRVERSIPGVAPLTGIVVMIAPTWVMVRGATTGGPYVALRRAHIHRVRRARDGVLVGVGAATGARARCDLAGIELASTQALLRTVGDAFATVRIVPERFGDQHGWLGQVVGFGTGTVGLMRIDPRAGQSSTPLAVPLRAITRVEFGGRRLDHRGAPVGHLG